MTDIDGKNLIQGVALTELTYFMDWGFEARVDQQFFWSTLNRITDVDNRMPCRSNARVSKLRLEITSNALVTTSEFVLTKNGNDEHVFDVGIGEIGVFTPPTGTIFSYLKDDFIDFRFREAGAFQTVIFKMACTVQFDAI